MFKAIRNLFAKSPIVEKIIRDPEVSEPVYMMIKAMKSRPQDWRFRLVTLPGPNDYKGLHRHECNYKFVNVEVTDRRVGYTYRLILEVDYSGWLYSGNIYRTSSNPMMVRRVVEYPAWLTHHEMIHLSHELGALFSQRIQRVLDYHSRKRNRAEAAAQERIKEIMRLERERVIQIYTEAQ